MPCLALEGGYARTSSPSKPASRNLVALNPRTTLTLFMLSQKKTKVLVIQSNSATPWTVAHQATLSMEFSRQEYWSGLPCPPPGDLPNPGIEPRSLKLQVDSLLSEPPGKPKNTGMESLSLLQGIFLTQESNQVSFITGGFFTN